MTASPTKTKCYLDRGRRFAMPIALACLGALHSAHAATMFVRAAEVEINDNGLCSLIEAMENATADAAVHPDCPAGSGADVIILATASTYTLKTVVPDRVENGFFLGLPPVSTAMTLQGSRTVIERASAPNTPAFGLLGVTATGKLTLRGLTLANSFSVTGAIFNVGSTTVVNSTLSGNTLQGASFNLGTLSFVNSSLIGNSSGTGGAVFNNGGNLSLLNTTMAGNSANRGGAIVGNGGSLTLVNATISRNSAVAEGGAIFNNSFNATIVNSTFAGNRSELASGGAIFHRAGALTMTNVIIADSTGGDCVVDAGSINTNLNNFVADGSCGAAFSGDPKLGPLANNGASILTHGLLPGSPAIDAGADCSKAPVRGRDQRGLKRDAKCDIGAVEFETAGPTATLSRVPAVTRAGATKQLFTVTYRDNAAVDMMSVNNDDVSVQDPNGNVLPVFLVGVNAISNGTPRLATYQLIPPNGRWDARANGTYTIMQNAGKVVDVAGNAIGGGALGSFSVAITAP